VTIVAAIVTAAVILSLLFFLFAVLVGAALS
jgi:hypothetical protein